MRAATYNVHGCIGTDGQLSPDRIARVIGQLDAHFIGLQEVHCSPDGNGMCELDAIAKLSKMRAVSGGIRAGHRGTYGNAVLTSLPVIASNLIDLSVSGREPRGALDVYLAADSSTVRVVVAHLGLAPWERRNQCLRLVDALTSDGQPADVTVLLGDVNEWFHWGRPLRWLAAAFGRSAHIRTFPSYAPMFALDRIWVLPQGSLNRSWRHANSLTRKASDHLPLVAEIALPKST